MVLSTGIARLSPKEEEESDQGESRSVKEEETTEHEEKPLVTVPAVFRRPFEPVSFSISSKNTTDLQIRSMCILKARISELARLCYNALGSDYKAREMGMAELLSPIAFMNGFFWGHG